MTEVISDNLAPSWVKSFDVQYHFEQRENYKVEVYDVDDLKNVSALANHDFAGSLEFAIHEVVTARDQTLDKPLINPAMGVGKSGNIRIIGEEKVVGSKDEVLMKIKCRFPDVSGVNFFLINKIISPTVQKPIYKSEIKSPVGGVYEWNLINILSADLAGDDVDREIKFDFF